MKTILMFVLLVAVPWLAKASWPDLEPQAEIPKYTCSSQNTDGLDYRYCFRDLDTTNSSDIVFFLHGLGGSEETWFTQYLGTLIIQKLWRDKGYRPRIVTVSFGEQWLLVDTKSLSLLPFFTQKVIPTLEQVVGGIKTGKRFLIGQSMGGYNAAVLSLKTSGLFSRVALLCPAITTIGPYSSEQDVQDYINRTHASTDLVQKMLNITRSVFANQNEWDQHDPLLLLKNPNDPRATHFFVSTGKNDEYGFQEGSEVFNVIAGQQGYLSKWTPVVGGHCNFSREGTAKFIMGL